MPSILPGGFAEHLAGANYALVLPSILPGGFAMLSAMQLAGGNPLSFNLTLPTAKYKCMQLRPPKLPTYSIFFLKTYIFVERHYKTTFLHLARFWIFNCKTRSQFASLYMFLSTRPPCKYKFQFSETCVCWKMM